MRIIYRAEHSIYKKYVSQFFLPSIEMNKHVSFPQFWTSSLPPGAENNLSKRNYEQKDFYVAVYVGGLSFGYGISNLLEAVNILNKDRVVLKLKLVCRIKEFETSKELFAQYIDKTWLQILHLSGEKLEQVYSTADFAILPLRKTKYNDFAVPVKLFEYLSYGLPVVATNCSAQKSIVSNNNNGIICEDSSESIAFAITEIMNEKMLGKLRINAEISLFNNNLWFHRAEEVSETLIGEKNS